jgi:hypothetical protein
MYNYNGADFRDARINVSYEKLKKLSGPTAPVCGIAVFA